MVKVVDVFVYRSYILNKLDESKYDLAYKDELSNYNNFNKFIQSVDCNGDYIYMVGYNIKTCNGNKWMPVFSSDYGRLKIKVNKEIKIKYKKYERKQILWTILMHLYARGGKGNSTMSCIPLEIGRMIYQFL